MGQSSGNADSVRDNERIAYDSGASPAEFAGIADIQEELRHPLPSDDCEIVKSERGFRLRRRDFLGPLGEDIDPQSVFPKKACVFVANLPYAHLDMEIEAAVARVFQQYGTVFVKVRRERAHGNLPYAFAQYIDPENAQAALIGGNGVTILGRKCRTEMAKSRTFYVVYRRDGGDLTIEEVEDMVRPYAAINCRMLEDQVRDELGISAAVKVEFDVFDPTLNINRCIRHNPQFHIDAVNYKKSQIPINPTDEFHDIYEKCRRTLYVTDLPPGFSEEDIRECFGPLGGIHTVKTAQTTRGDAYCFVEFDDDRAVMQAMARGPADSFYIHGYQLKIERKIFKPPKSKRARRQQSQQVLVERASEEFGHERVELDPRPQTPTSQVIPEPRQVYSSYAFVNQNIATRNTELSGKRSVHFNDPEFVSRHGGSVFRPSGGPKKSAAAQARAANYQNAVWGRPGSPTPLRARDGDKVHTPFTSRMDPHPLSGTMGALPVSDFSYGSPVRQHRSKPSSTTLGEFANVKIVPNPNDNGGHIDGGKGNAGMSRAAKGKKAQQERATRAAAATHQSILKKPMTSSKGSSSMSSFDDFHGAILQMDGGSDGPFRAQTPMFSRNDEIMESPVSLLRETRLICTNQAENDGASLGMSGIPVEDPFDEFELGLAGLSLNPRANELAPEVMRQMQTPRRQMQVSEPRTPVNQGTGNTQPANTDSNLYSQSRLGINPLFRGGKFGEFELLLDDAGNPEAVIHNTARVEPDKFTKATKGLEILYNQHHKERSGTPALAPRGTTSRATRFTGFGGQGMPRAAAGPIGNSRVGNRLPPLRPTPSRAAAGPGSISRSGNRLPALRPTLPPAPRPNFAVPGPVNGAERVVPPPLTEEGADLFAPTDDNPFAGMGAM
ncbi:hypothetical protein B0H67DRAFT_547766 [Lasiosphaeris hirsuta]|uniref:RRM domain-containing protein n=1 Tax=Lasiosphaeris hirsuta TaxID=260670 RepID=A0AA40B8R0_9PEZI|nr:hypothetical protein B0H67DRAFT_547766 [Lasiosphaeris hirsuta]